MDADHVKEWLIRYSDAVKEVKYAEERYLTMKSKVGSLSSPVLDGMPRGPGTSDRTASAIIRLEELQETIAALNDTADLIYNEIDAAVEQISGNGYIDMRAVIRMRYLDLCDWNEVNEMMFSRTKDDFLDRESSYLKRIFRIHKKALEELAALLPDSSPK